MLKWRYMTITASDTLTLEASEGAYYVEMVVYDDYSIRHTNQPELSVRPACNVRSCHQKSAAY